jgi:superfamily II DNA/RNA helicase
VVASATLGPRSDAFIARFMPDRVAVDAPPNALTSLISHHALRVPTGRSRDVVLARFLQEQRCRAAIVFVNDPDQQSHLFHFLREHGHQPVTVTHERGKQARAQGLEAFRTGAARVMLVSDSTARGLDVPGVAWVLHYDLPRSAAAYVHRAGRTGRAGQRGASVVLVEDAARGALRRLSKELGVVFEGA